MPSFQPYPFHSVDFRNAAIMREKQRIADEKKAAEAASGSSTTKPKK